MSPLPNRHRVLAVMCLAFGLVHCAAEASPSSFSDEPTPDLVQAPIDDSPDGRRASPPSEPTNNEPGGGAPCGRPTGYDEIMIDGKAFRVPYFEACRDVGPRDLVDPQPF